MLDDLKSDEELTTLATHATFIEGDLVFQSDLLKKPALEILPNEFFLAVKPPSVEHVQVSAGTNEEPSNEKIPSALDPMLQALWASQQPTIAARSNEGAKSANNHAEGPYQFFGEYVVVDVRAQDGMAQDLLTELEGLGLRSGAAFGNIVSGLMPVMSLGDLESAQHIRYASASLMKTNVGAVTQQGDAAMQTDAARTTFDVDGTGLTIGTLSDSYDDLGGAVLGVGTGDLPNNVVVLEDLSGSGSDEGRAMIELIFDVAPGADQLFHTAFLGQANFAQGIIDLQNAGADIIVDDVFYFAEPFFQDGIIAQAVDQVVENGALYFSSAGNSGRDSWEDGFRASAETISGVSGTLHDFDSGAGDDARMNITLANGGSILLSFQWDEPFAAAGGAGSASDVDIFLLEAGTDTIVAASAADNIANGDPVEIFSFTNTTGSTQSYDIVISLFAGAAPGLMKFIDFDGVATYNEYFTFSSTVVGHSNAVGANAIGASAFFFTPEFGQNPPILNNFSSFGTTPIFFEDDGTRLATEEVRTGPVFTAPDGGNTTFFGSDSGADADAFPNFFGTSAAAPNAAAAAALMKEAVPEATNAQIIQALSETAIDIVQTSDGVALSAGSDIGSGAGLIQVDAAIVRLMELVNTPPDAQNDLVTTDEDTAFSGNVLADNGSGIDSDADGDALTVTAVNGVTVNVGEEVTLASGALLTLNSDGTFDYDPNGQFETLSVSETDTDSFVYTLSDASDSADATVTITINGVNDAPVADPLSISGNEDADILSQLTASDIDTDQASLTFLLDEGPSTGAIEINADGTFTYTPNRDFAGTDSFTFVVNDGLTNATPAIVTISVRDLPEDDVFGNEVVGGVDLLVMSVNDTGGNEFFVYFNDGNANFETNDELITRQTNQFVAFDMDGDGDQDLVASKFNSSSGAFAYRNDGQGLFTDTGQLINLGTGNEFELVSGDFDNDGDEDVFVPSTAQLSAILTNDGTGLFSIFTGLSFDARGAAAGDLDGDGDTDILYGFQGATNSIVSAISGGANDFTFIVQDLAGLGITGPYEIELADIDKDNDLDAAFIDQNEQLTIFENDGSGNFSFLYELDEFSSSAAEAIKFADLNGDTHLDLVVATEQQSGKPDLVYFNDGAGNFSDDNTFSFSGNTRSQGVDVSDFDNDGDIDVVFADITNSYSQVWLNDGDGTFTKGQNLTGVSGSFVLAFDANQDADPVGLAANQTHILDVLANDPSPVTLIEVNGSPVEIRDTVTLTSDLLVTLNEDQTLLFDPTSSLAVAQLQVDETLTETFTYTIDDGEGPLSATVTVIIGGINDAPTIAGDGEISVSESGSVILSGNDFLGSDVDDESSVLTYTISNLLNGSIQVGGQSVTSFSQVDLGTGAVSFLHDGTDSALAGFDVTVQDDGSASSEIFSVSVTVQLENNAPEAQDDAFTTSESMSVSGNLLDDNGSGADVDDDSPSLLVSAINGDTELVGEEIELSSGALLTLGSDGSFTYDPNGRFEQLASGGTGTDSFSYTISDGEGGSDTALVMISVSGENDAPTLAGDLSIAVTEGQSVLLSISDITGSDVDDDSASLIYTVSNLLNGSIRINDQSVSTFSQADLEGGNVFFVHDGSEAETASFDVFVEDDIGAPSDTSTVEATVQAVNDAPTLSGDRTVFVLEGGTAILDTSDFAAADVDDELSSLTYEVSELVGGLVQVSGLAQNIFSQSDLDAGLVSFVHDGSETPNASFNVVVRDDELASSPSLTVDVLVTPQNDLPIAFADAFMTLENRILAGNLFADNGNGPDSDADLDDLSVISISLNGETFSAGEQLQFSSGALLIVNEDGTFAYDANGVFDALEFRQSQSEADTVEYTISDGFAVSTASIKITIVGVNNSIIVGSFRGEILTGTAVGDDIFGRGGDDIINGGDGNDFIEGNGGRDEIEGGDGDDELIGGDGGDLLFGGDGDDIISGRRGSDFIQAGAGNDDVAGRGLRDIIFGGSGDDTLRGNGGEDELFGETGNDELVGGQGNDLLFGGDGDDFLDGRSGDDVLSGGAGNDDLRGSAGSDTFVFEAGHELATILDFQDNQDLLDLSAYGFGSLDEAISNMQQVGSDVLFAVGTDQLTITDVNISELQDDILI